MCPEGSVPKLRSFFTSSLDINLSPTFVDMNSKPKPSIAKVKNNG